MAVVGSDICYNCDDYVVKFPSSFHIRVYDNGLRYHTYNTLRYATKFANVFIYTVMKTRHKVVVWVDTDVIVARYEQQGTHRVMRFAPYTHIENIVCSMITDRQLWAVPEGEPRFIEAVLF